MIQVPTPGRVVYYAPDWTAHRRPAGGHDLVPAIVICHEGDGVCWLHVLGLDKRVKSEYGMRPNGQPQFRRWCYPQPTSDTIYAPESGLEPEAPVTCEHCHAKHHGQLTRPCKRAGCECYCNR